jgi:hypothetical protein
MSDRKLEDMGTFEQARWYSLMEAVNIIGDECEERGKDFNQLKLSPLDLQKYIEGTCDIFARKIEEQNREDAHKVEHMKNVNIRLQHVKSQDKVTI